MAVAALVISGLALALASRAAGSHRADVGASSDAEVAALGLSTSTDPADLRADINRLMTLLATTRDEMSDSIRHIAVIRYDAFQDVTGRLSYSAALLDNSGDGIVMSSLQGREESRHFVKGVVRGKAEGLTPEEQRAIAHAMGGVGA